MQLHYRANNSSTIIFLIASLQSQISSIVSASDNTAMVEP